VVKKLVNVKLRLREKKTQPVTGVRGKRSRVASIDGVKNRRARETVAVRGHKNC